MKDPQIIFDVSDSNTIAASYNVPTYKVTNEGLVDGDGFVINFCKGDKSDETKFRQEGFFSETLIKVVKTYLETVNVGEMATNETSISNLNI